MTTYAAQRARLAAPARKPVGVYQVAAARFAAQPRQPLRVTAARREYLACTQPDTLPHFTYAECVAPYGKR